MTITRELVVSQTQLTERITQLAAEISRDYRSGELVLIGVLNGAFIFLADLARAVSIEHQIDFVRVASYGSNTSSSGEIRLSKDVELDVAGKDVVLVEDIIDTGITLAWLEKHFAQKRARSTKICALIDKKERREAAVRLDYCGFKVEKGFLVGYGLDFDERYRHLPEIYSLHFNK